MGLNFKIDRNRIDNFWYYYKAHVIATIFIVIVIGITFRDCANNVSPDISIAYIGDKYIAEELSQSIKEILSDSETIKDANGDGKYVAAFTPLTVSDEIRGEQDIAIQQKIMIMLAAGEIQVFIVNRTYLEIFIKQGAFLPIDSIVQEYGIDINENPEIKFKSEDSVEEKIYAIPLQENKFFNELGFNTKDSYIAVRVYNEKDIKNEKKKAMMDNAYSIVNKVLSE